MDGVKSFIRSVLVESVPDRPDPIECVRILMNSLFDVPLDGVARQNELESLCRSISNVADEDRPLLADCLYLSLSELL